MMKILVVEDERLLADSLQTLLTGRGFSVDTANDGLTGLEYAKTDMHRCWWRQNRRGVP